MPEGLEPGINDGVAITAHVSGDSKQAPGGGAIRESSQQASSSPNKDQGRDLAPAVGVESSQQESPSITETPIRE